MARRIGLSYLISALFPVLSLLVLALRLFAPNSRYVAVALYVCGCLGLAYGLFHHKEARARLTRAKGQTLEVLEARGLLKKRAMISGAIFALSLVVFPLLVPLSHLEGFVLPSAAYELDLEQDEARLAHISEVLPRAKKELVLAARSFEVDDAASRGQLKSAWASYAEMEAELARIFDKHRYFFQVAAQDETLADRGFVCAYSALLEDLNSAQPILKAVGQKPGAEVVLNEGDETLGLRPGSYREFASSVTDPAQLLRLRMGNLYLRTLLHLKPEVARHGAPSVLRRSNDLLDLLGSEPTGLLDAPFDVLEAKIERAWLPLQRGAAKTISPIRTRKRSNFVSEEQLKEAHTRLSPLDILVERRNWYLTNIGIPGFWPHAALYIGSLEELDSEFDTEARVSTDGLAPSRYIQQNFPEAYQALAQPDAEGHTKRIIEAIGEGVVVQSLEHSGHADYVAALRPRLDDKSRLSAVLTALSYFNKPYDYNFEFSTDDAVVCSELVYKALGPSEKSRGIRFPLTTQNGRFLLPPNDIVRSFDEHYQKPDQSLDFVFFLDGSEETQSAHFADVAALRDSWRRPKWDIVQR